jgi:hypothetical protein
MPAVEFPSPYDGSESVAAPSSEGWTRRTEPLRRNAISTARNSSQGLALSRSVLHEASATHSMGHTRPRGASSLNCPFHKSQRAGGTTARAP